MIKYRAGYKYQLAETYVIVIPLSIGMSIKSEFIELKPKGIEESVLTILRGYAWDGPSGPTFDTKDSMRGSLVHDALYQMMRQGLLSQFDRDVADDVFRSILLEDGMNKNRARRWYKGVKYFAADSASPESLKEIYEAP